MSEICIVLVIWFSAWVTNEHVGGHTDGIHGVYGAGQRNLEGRMLLEFCQDKEICVSNTWFEREERRNVTFILRENDIEIGFVLIRIKHWQFLRNFNAIPCKSWHALVIADIDKKKIRNVV